ncbi:MAG: sodium:proton antiporter NhaD [Kiloniellales bacterium]|nr:sodium:proton antiporter NhaD [Kiloniellales bacterium]
MYTRLTTAIISGLAALVPTLALAAPPREKFLVPDPTEVPAAYLCLGIFLFSYIFVMTEEKTHMRKSKPVILGAGIIWALVAWLAPGYGFPQEAIHDALIHGLEEYAGLLLFLLAAMTYISALQAGNVFEALRAWLVSRGFSYRALFWITGIIAFFLSPIADNMTTALVMGTVIMAVGAGNPKFVALGFINVVVAANAGGAFSPFGDITTLMVWVSGRASFFEFFALFIPSVVNYVIPAAVMTFFLPQGQPEKLEETVRMKRGAPVAVLLFVLTIAMAISFEQVLHLPAFMGMMTGLSLLMFFAYFHRKTRSQDEEEFDIFQHVAAAEWDTLLFFFGVIFSVGALSFIGWLTVASEVMYGDWGATAANTTLGIVSAIVDNIPVMFAILSMGPEMSHFQWLLITLTCGTGGSLLSIGSAAGVALMGASKGQYTFMGHLKWAPVIALGYFASIWVHFLVNG